MSRFRDKLVVWFMPPVLPDRLKFHVRVQRRSRAAGVYLVFGILFAAWFVATVGGLGAVIESRSWAKWIEIARTAATLGVIYLLVS